MSTTPRVGTTKYYVGGQEVPPPAPPTQLDRIETLLAQIRDALTQRAAPLPAVPYEQVAGMMERFDGPTMGVTATRADLPAGSDDLRTSAAAPSPLMQAIPLPPKRGDDIYHVAGPNGELPDRTGTPGAINPDVTDDPAVLKATIGTPGWTATVRPPVSYTNALKIQVMAEYGLTGDPATFELDHLVPLCAGGNPTSQQNLWAQRRTGVNGASVKDLTEVAAQHAILSGAMSLRDVQQGFCTDWTALHARLFSNPVVVKSMMAMAMEPPEDEP